MTGSEGNGALTSGGNVSMDSRCFCRTSLQIGGSSRPARDPEITAKIFCSENISELLNLHSIDSV